MEYRIAKFCSKYFRYGRVSDERRHWPKGSDEWAAMACLNYSAWHCELDIRETVSLQCQLDVCLSKFGAEKSRPAHQRFSSSDDGLAQSQEPQATWHV